PAAAPRRARYGHRRRAVRPAGLPAGPRLGAGPGGAGRRAGGGGAGHVQLEPRVPRAVARPAGAGAYGRARIMIASDASYGVGGGPTLRTSLTLAALTGQAARLTGIRAGRSKPGLAPQHLTAVRAAAQVCAAEVRGDKLRSTQLTFAPGAPPIASDLTIDVADAAQ